jgi:copper(I)-binding protein
MKPALSLALLIVSLALAVPAAGAATSLQIKGGWSRPAPAGGNGVGYFTIVNPGPKPETLVRVDSPVAQRVEMHSMSMQGAVMKMGPVASVTAPAGGEVSFAPGGYHLMLIGLKKPLAVGDKAPLTLTFASGVKLAATLGIGVMPPTM